MSEEAKVHPPHVFNPELVRVGLKQLTPPFRYSYGYVWGSGGSEMFADRCGVAADGSATRIRGWGRLSYVTEVNPEQLQDELGHMYAQALTDYWEKHQNTLTVVLPRPGTPTPELEQFAAYFAEHWVNEGQFSIRFSEPGVEQHCFTHRWYELEIHSLGIKTSLWEGDIITLLQGRINIQRKPVN